MVEEIIKIICDQLHLSLERVALDSNIVDDLGADSLDIVELAERFESRFNMTVSDEDIMEIKTVYDIINYIENHK